MVTSRIGYEANTLITSLYSSSVNFLKSDRRSSSWKKNDLKELNEMQFRKLKVTKISRFILNIYDFSYLTILEIDTLSTFKIKLNDDSAFQCTSPISIITFQKKKSSKVLSKNYRIVLRNLSLAIFSKSNIRTNWNSQSNVFILAPFELYNRTFLANNFCDMLFQKDNSRIPVIRLRFTFIIK